jgi:response regulator RpfG family c-di-GMP phosphodiesterase
MEAKHALLLVDDEENILNSLRRIFRREPFEVLTAASGMEGLELLQTHTVSVIVSDQRMPKMVGAEFLRRSIELAPHAVRIMLTGYADVEATVQAINKGQVYRYVTKPWNDGEMKMVVRAAAHRFDLQESNRQLTAELNTVNAQLDTLDSKLEQRVEERTRELRSAYEENLRLTEALELKVKELERSDRIQSDYNR